MELDLDKFERIKKAYREFYNSLLRSGKVNCRSTDIGYWGCSSPDIIFEFFKEIKLWEYDYFLDIGSGDGIVVLIASLFTKANGVEFDKELYEKSVEMKEKLDIFGAEFLNFDFNGLDISCYDVFFINPDQSFSRSRVEEKLLAEMKGKLFVYNCLFSPNLLKKGKTYWYDQLPISVWTT